MELQYCVLIQFMFIAKALCETTSLTGIGAEMRSSGSLFFLGIRYNAIVMQLCHFSFCAGVVTCSLAA